ncbi:MAG TPA: two-component regulator propeller domain-containing protein [Cyclobacteriaceae bacterium]|nr:two-component regulator propeller domain-containing protein [Cyclobacteriaceae bacterium]
MKSERRIKIEISLKRLLVAGLLLFSIQITAQTPFFSTLSSRDGLPSNVISSIVQDHHNFIWIGTGNGVCRYDGYKFISFKKNETANSIPANEISSLVVDNDFVWIGTWKGLCKINTATFEITQIDIGDNNVIRTLYKGSDNTIWIGTATGLFRYLNNKFTLYTKSNGLSHNTIRAIYEDHEKNLWVGTYDKLNKLVKGQDHFETYDLKGSYKPSLKNNLISGDIKPYSANSDSLLWIGTETGLCLFNTITKKTELFNERNTSLSNEVIKCMYTDAEGNFWLGTDFGLNVFNPKTKSTRTYFHNPQLSYSIANNVIWQIFEDRGGVIWFVTSNGLSRLNSHSNFYQYHEVLSTGTDQPIGNQVKSILITRKGILWLATLHGVIRIDEVNKTRQIFDTQSPERSRILINNIYALEEDDLGRIWIGTAGGINIWNEYDQKMYSITANASNGLISNYIARFTKGIDGSFWVSAWEGGLFKVTGNFNDISSLHFKLVYDYGTERVVSGSNAVWGVRYNELFKIQLNTSAFSTVKTFNALTKGKDINSLYYSNKGILWAGTKNGLIEYNTQQNLATLHPIVTGNDVNLDNIIEDGNGNIWAASNNFILKFNTAADSTEIFPLDKDIPLKSFFNNCAAKTASGEIMFGGDNGYITLSPSIKPNVYKPDVYITTLEINNSIIATNQKIDGKILLQSDISFTKNLVLDYAQHSIAFEFSALHYWQPAMNVYAYKLEGFDKDWNYVSGLKNFAVYSNLSSGDYTLRVKGTNNYGIWSDQEATLHINVKPPLFLSTAFIILYIIIVIAIIIIALRTYSARIHLKNELKIALLEKEHDAEIYQTKQQFFTNISHELRTPISLILPPIQQIIKSGSLSDENEKLIELAEKNSHRLLRVVNQILDIRKLENDSLPITITSFDMVAFLRDLHHLFIDKAQRNAIEFTLNSHVHECMLWADTEKIETIFFNLLSNAFKFTPQGGIISITLSISPPEGLFTDGSVNITVIDNGIGIDAEEQKKIFDRFYQTKEAQKMELGSGIGLTLAAEYVKLHHGDIQVESNKGEGTSFTVKLPLGNSHFPIDSIHTQQEVNLLATRTTVAYQDERLYRFGSESSNPMVLIIEDNQDMIDFIKLSLQHKYNFITAWNGEEGLTKVNNFMPELIISDIMMPVMDGLTLCKKIKENPKTTHIPTILLTAKSLTTQKVEGIRMGADLYLTKPFEVELLEAHIDHLLRRKKELADYFRHELIIQPSAEATGENIDEKFIKKVMGIIEANISNTDFGVDKLSEEIGMSTTHLYRKLKSLTQLSANDIIRKYRLKKASILLGNKEGNISEIMYDVGFSNLSYFSKCFKVEFGLSPKDYQQKVSKSSVDIAKEINSGL